MPAERPPTKASENRRATKPIMEKRRRARINQCLSELKALILDALNKDPSRHSKLEKADILEMTVRHLQNIQRQQMAAAISSDPTVLNKFKAGFNECAQEVSRYINRMEGVEPALRQRLLAHLSNCMTTMNAATTFSQSSVMGFANTFPGMMTPLQSLSVQIPSTLTVPTVNIMNSNSRTSSPGDINNNSSPNNTNNNNNNNTNNNNNGSSGGKIFSGLSLIPSRLPNGDLAFLLPSQALTCNNQGQVFGIPSSSASSLPSSSGPERTSNSSWPPSSPMSASSRRSASPATSENSALSPTGSDGGSDVFIEPYKQRETVLCSPVSRTRPNMHQHQITSNNIHNQNTFHQQQAVIRAPQPIPESENVWRPW